MALLTDVNELVFVPTGLDDYDLTALVYFKTSDIAVYIIDDEDIATLLAETTNYTLTDGTNGAGVLTTVATYVGGKLKVVRVVEYTQDLDGINGDGFDTDVRDKQLDKIVMQTQQLGRETTLSFRLADSDVSGASLIVPTLIASKLLGVSSDGLSIVLEDQAVGGVIPDESITNAKMATLSIALLNMQADSVGTTQLVDLNVTEDKLAAAVTAKLNLNILASKTVAIGDWDMDTAPTKSVNLGLAGGSVIRSIDVTIYQDSGTRVPFDYGLNVTSSAEPTIEGWVGSTSTSTITLVRRDGGYFDGTDFDSTSFNRGYVTVWYQP